MKTITLKLIDDIKIPLEFDNVLPELLYDKSIDDIKNTIIYQGNSTASLDTFFEIQIEGDATSSSDCRIIINGNLDRIKYIGKNMTSGTIIANGNVDLQAASQMAGGHIIVNGDAESYAALDMTGGLLEINGSVKEFCGSAYTGEWRGMSGGQIIIKENAGRQVANFMTGGFIHIKGNCDILPGVHMTGGVVQIDGNVKKWPAGQMKKGTIIINGKVGELLHGFKKQETLANPLINGKYYVGKYELYVGDKTVNGKGQLWIKK